MKKFYFTFILTLFLKATIAQEILLSFQSEDQSKTIDSIRVTNLNSGISVKLFATDSLLLTDATSINEIQIPSDLVYPNPCNGSARLFLNTVENNAVEIKIYSITGQVLSNYIELLHSGRNAFYLKFPGKGIFVVSIQIDQKIICQKVINMGTNQSEASIEFAGTFNSKSLKQGLAIKTLGFSPTDIIHYLVYSDNDKTVFTDSPGNSKNYKVVFHKCLQADSRSYKTVQIGEQVWMAENLAFLPNVSDWKTGSNNDPYYYVGGYNGTDINEAMQKQAYTKYGVLYNLPAALRVCPVGWHLPSDLEWDELARYVSDQKGPFEKTDMYWYDVGRFLKASDGWSNNGNGTDAFGFSALPAGERTSGGNPNTGQFSNFWSATAYFGTTTYFWYMGGAYTWIKRTTGMNDQGFSVRCVQDKK